MTKPLAGKRYFEALGRRHESLGYPYLAQRGAMWGWPLWAKRAYCLGRIQQAENHAKRTTAAGSPLREGEQ